MLRFVLGPDAMVVPDIEERLPGRGLWLTADRTALDRAVARRAFAKAAGAPVRVPENLAAQVDALLARRCLSLLGLARRAGQVVAGFEQVRELLKGGDAAALLAASDGAENGRRRLRAVAGELPVVGLFAAAEIGAALGRGTVVHAALSRGRLANRFLREAGRLADFRRNSEEHPQARASVDRA
jgi:uncharacterized protein